MAFAVGGVLAGAGCTGPAAGPGAAAGVAAARAGGTPSAASEGGIALRIVAFNDFHGQLEPGGLTLRLRDPADPARSWPVGAGGVAQFATQLVDLVAKPCRVLELELGGRLVHLLFERLDETSELLLRQ